MPTLIEIKVLPAKIDDSNYLLSSCAQKLKLTANRIEHIEILRKSIDGRGRKVHFVLKIAVYMDGEKFTQAHTSISYKNVTNKRKILIVGAGPAGYFAALRCLELGLCPVVLERGKNVRDRRRDLRQIQQFGIVNPNSNYCFGEGGAGTYSDGKLYTRSTKRGNVAKILNILVDHGASSDILIDAHPHIGSNKLPGIVANIRDTIESFGGQVMFNARVVDFLVQQNKMLGVSLESGESIFAESTILATGHSARDIYLLCESRGVEIEFKPFAIGARVEHPQALIDEIQYNQKIREANLPAASYRLSCQIGNKGVFSFCMCPGGLIVPAATSPGELVVNGMSLSKRDSPYANSATVVTLDANPIEGDLLGGMKYQAQLEQSIFNFGDGSQKAPAQRLLDFVNKRISVDLGSSSYIPGIYSAPMHELLPDWISNNISKALIQFDQKMKGYYTNEAMIIGLESRTSAPVRICRDKSTLMSNNMKGLFPCAEGAGYAGGILSAALDGDRIADSVYSYLKI